MVKLENKLFLAGNSDFVLDDREPSKKSEFSMEIDLLKNDLETLNFRLSSSTSDLDREQLRNAELSAKVSTYDCI